jgi:uncharacterized membrane protein YhiD involved in acid resistance
VTSEIKAVFIGAGIALAGGTVGAFLQHFLSLRTDRIKRERDRQEQESSGAQERREEQVRWLRDKQDEADRIEASRKAREIERLREVLLESVSTRLAPQDLERFLQEVERKHSVCPPLELEDATIPDGAKHEKTAGAGWWASR